MWRIHNAYPKTLEGLNRFGASSWISSFVLPLGYSFNLDGTMMYCTFAAVFIAQTYHVVWLGCRESSPPFSFLDQSNRPIGYSLELCEAIVEEIGTEVDEANLRIEYVKVTSDDRIQAVLDNKIDLECGSTTANAERSKQVAFSPLMFVAGIKLMVPKTSGISAITDMKGKTVVVTRRWTIRQVGVIRVNLKNIACAWHYSNQRGHERIHPESSCARGNFFLHAKAIQKVNFAALIKVNRTLSPCKPTCHCTPSFAHQMRLTVAPNGAMESTKFAGFY